MTAALAGLGALVLLASLVWDERRSGWSLGFFFAAAVWHAITTGQVLGSSFEAAMLLVIGLVGVARGYANRPRWRTWVRYAYATALFFALLSLRFVGTTSGPLPWSLVVFHAGVLTLAYVSLTVAFLAAVAGWAQHRRLKSAPWRSLSAPPLLGLARLEGPYLRAGYVLYTVGVLTGMAWAWRLWGSPVAPDVKELATLVTWALFTLLLLEHRPGRVSGGRVLLWWAAYAALVFVFFVAPYWGGRHPV
ncbi:cytochrome c biogenesis protein CcsA [Oceanithermus desulfurans]